MIVLQIYIIVALLVGLSWAVFDPPRQDSDHNLVALSMFAWPLGVWLAVTVLLIGAVRGTAMAINYACSAACSNKR